MIKRPCFRFYWITGLWLLSLLGVGAATPDSFTWRLPIEGTIETGAWYRVAVPAAVYAGSHRHPNDIRIFDAEGRSWPFMRIPRPVSKAQVRAHTIVNQAWTEQAGLPYLRMDLHLDHPPAAARRRHHEIVIETSDHNFIRRVDILGSEDTRSWAHLGAGYLIDSQRPRRMQEQIIHYPLSDYPYLQVRIFANARNMHERFTVRHIQVRYRGDKPEPGRVVPHERLPVSPRDHEDGAQVFVLDLGYEQHPAHQLRIDRPATDHVRRVVVYGRNQVNESWRMVGSGHILQIGDHRRDVIQLNSRNRYLKCVLYDFDDPPLEVVGFAVTTHADFLLLNPLGASAYLYFGHPDIAAPRFDIDERRPESVTDHAPLLAVGAVEANPLYRRAGLGPLGPVLATLAIALTSLLVIAVIVRMMKQQLNARP